MRYERECRAFLMACLAVLILVGIGTSDAFAGGDEVVICPLIQAKQMPAGFKVAAMTFTGPAGDGRRGSAGFVVRADELVEGGGSRLTFVFQRDASGHHFQVIHPFENGHVLVSRQFGRFDSPRRILGRHRLGQSQRQRPR